MYSGAFITGPMSTLKEYPVSWWRVWWRVTCESAAHSEPAGAAPERGATQSGTLRGWGMAASEYEYGEF